MIQGSEAMYHCLMVCRWNDNMQSMDFIKALISKHAILNATSSITISETEWRVILLPLYKDCPFL